MNPTKTRPHKPMLAERTTDFFLSPSTFERNLNVFQKESNWGSANGSNFHEVAIWQAHQTNQTTAHETQAGQIVELLQACCSYLSYHMLLYIKAAETGKILHMPKAQLQHSNLPVEIPGYPGLPGHYIDSMALVC